jgi:hypothetical protein
MRIIRGKARRTHETPGELAALVGGYGASSLSKKISINGNSVNSGAEPEHVCGVVVLE